MKKVLSLLLAAMLLLSLAACAAAPATVTEPDAPVEIPQEPVEEVPVEEPAEEPEQEPEPEPAPEPEPEPYSDFTVVTQVFDGGQAVTHLILNMLEEITAADIDTDAIEVRAHHINDAKRRVMSAYPSDAEGNAVDSGAYLTLELMHDYSASSGFYNNAGTTYYNMSTWTNVLYELDHTVTIGDKLFTQSAIVNLLEDEFSFETSESGLNYRLYSPDEAAESARPLIIWLHGMGEGGSDNRLQIIGNKACNFGSEEIQAYFGGAYVAAPQCPDYWAGGFNFGGRSPYADDMISLIEEVIANNNVDPSRVYVGGCSMGGYMTWQTILAKPELFAAAFPVCAAYAPTEADAQLIAENDLPVWVVYSTDDTTVNPDEFPRASVAALEAADADVRVTEFENVTEDGITYNGHYSWIYVYNNHVADENGTTIMEWMAAQLRGE